MLAAIVFIVPLVVYLKKVSLGQTAFQYWTGERVFSDFFHFYKSQVFIFLSALSMGWFALKMPKVKFNSIFFPLIIYAVCIIASMFSSEHTVIAALGFPGRYEGGLITLLYLWVFFVACNSTLRQVYRIMELALFASFLVFIVAMLQATGNDPFQWIWVQKIIMPEKLQVMGKYIKLSELATGTFYNKNYLGCYVALLLPFSLASAHFMAKLDYWLVTIALTCLLFISGSRAAYLGIGFSLIAYLLIHKVALKQIAIGSAAALILILGIDILSGGKRLEHLKDAIVEAQAMDKTVFSNITMTDTDFTIHEYSEHLNVKYKDGKLTLNGPLAPKFNFFLKDNTLIVRREKFDAHLKISDKLELWSPYTESVYKLEKPEISGFENRQHFATDRGYIWSRTIPLINKAPFFGYGPDTFVTKFPHNDLIGKYNVFRTTNIHVDKPHNWYLQIAFSTGMLSLICVLVMLFLYFISYSFGQKDYLATAFFLSICSYCVCMIFNDSSVGIAPLFWIMLGLGVRANEEESWND